MNSNLVILFARLSVAVNEHEKLGSLATPLMPWTSLEKDFDHVFESAGPHYVKLGAGLFLADETHCYLAIVRFLDLAEKHQLQCLVAPVSDSAFTCSGSEVRDFLAAKNHAHRLVQCRNRA